MNKQDNINKLLSLVIEKLVSENINITQEEFLSKVKKISFQNKYALWVLQRYLDNGIKKYEDFGRVEKSLCCYHRYKHRLEEKDRNIFNIKSLTALEELVDSFDELDKQKEIEKLNKEKIYSDTKIIYNGADGRILIPLTQQSAIFWGQGTKWCTTAEWCVGELSAFNYYSKQGPLYIFILNEKDSKGRETKYQLHFETGQFMDAKDNRLSETEIFKLKSIPLWSLFEKKIFSNMSKEDLMQKFCKNEQSFYIFNRCFSEKISDCLLETIEKSPHLIQYVSKINNQMKEIIVEKLKDNDFIKKNAKTSFFVNIMKKSHGFEIIEKHIPEFLTENPLLIQYVLEPTNEMKEIFRKQKNMTYEELIKIHKNINQKKILPFS